MKPLHYLSLAFFSISISACANTSNSNAAKNKLLYGTWNCKAVTESEGMKISIDADVTYVRNGRSNSFGTLKLNHPEIPELEYSYVDSAEWEVMDGYLVSMLSEIKLVNLSHPELDEVFNLGDMFPKNISGSSKILTLTQTKLSLKDESNGEVYNCTKPVIKS